MAVAEPPRRRRIWGRVLLALSLGVNFLVVGLIAGLVLSAGPGTPGRPGAELREAGRLPVAMMLPHEARRELRSRLRAAKSSDRSDERRATQQIDAALRAEPFEAQTLLALFAERRAQRDLRAASVDAALVEILATMAPAERAAFADRLQRRQRYHHEGPEGAGKPPRD